MRIVVDGTPWAGSYELPDFSFTNRELFRIKQVSNGIRGGELIEALEMNDAAAYVALAVVVIERSGRQVDVDALWDAPAGSVTLVVEEDKPAVPLGEQSGEGSSGNSGSSTPDSESGSDS